jgi:hypothetical protein
MCAGRARNADAAAAAGVLCKLVLAHLQRFPAATDKAEAASVARRSDHLSSLDIKLPMFPNGKLGSEPQNSMKMYPLGSLTGKKWSHGGLRCAPLSIGAHQRGTIGFYDPHPEILKCENDASS